MRAMIVAACILSSSLTWAEDAVVIKPPVRLDTQRELDDLRVANPRHYERAKRLLAAANTLCPPGRPTLQSAELDSRHLACWDLFLTSNPPKREISFRLDGIRYAALVTVTADPPKIERLQHADPRH